jgi:hypothetical protein
MLHIGAEELATPGIHVWKSAGKSSLIVVIKIESEVRSFVWVKFKFNADFLQITGLST